MDVVKEYNKIKNFVDKDDHLTYVRFEDADRFISQVQNEMLSAGAIGGIDISKPNWVKMHREYKWAVQPLVLGGLSVLGSMHLACYSGKSVLVEVVEARVMFRSTDSCAITSYSVAVKDNSGKCKRLIKGIPASEFETYFPEDDSPRDLREFECSFLGSIVSRFDKLGKFVDPETSKVFIRGSDMYSLVRKIDDMYKSMNINNRIGLLRWMSLNSHIEWSCSELVCGGLLPLGAGDFPTYSAEINGSIVEVFVARTTVVFRTSSNCAVESVYVRDVKGGPLYGPILSSEIPRYLVLCDDGNMKYSVPEKGRMTDLSSI